MELVLKTRRDCYDYLRVNPKLCQKILDKTGWNYTNLKTEVLRTFIINDYNSFKNKLIRFFSK